MVNKGLTGRNISKILKIIFYLNHIIMAYKNVSDHVENYVFGMRRILKLLDFKRMNKKYFVN